MMDNGVERAAGRRNILERIVDKIPGFKGYQNREMRREVDKMQRDWLAAQLDRGRQALQGKVRDWARSGKLDNLDLASSMEKLMDRFANRIRHADYGYTGFFDAVKVWEEELEKLYQFDLALSERVEDLANRIEALPSTASEAEIRSVLEAVENADRAFDDRSTVFEDVTQKGGR
jgi:hypothetical protein